jgi:multiple sugar transport system ATP-binding protein
MKDGYIQQVGTPYDLYFKPVNVFVAGFIGEPPMNFVTSEVKGGKVAVGNKELDLNAVLKADKLASYEGKKMVFGFRPEGTVLGAQDDAYVLDAEVELTELLGDNTNVYVDIDGVKSILKVDPHDTPKMDTKITFSIPYKNVYLFDGETEFVIEEGRK